MSGFSAETGWCHFTPTKWQRYYRLIEGEPDSIEGRLNKNNIPFYFDRVGGLHAKCNDGELWTFLSGQPSTFDSSKKLIKDVSDEYLVVSDIAVNLVPKTSAVKVNKIIEDLGLQKKEGKCWVATTSGEEYSRVFESEKQGFSNKSFMKWKFEVITIIQDYIDSK
jgi:hypothetical protein